MAHSGESPTAAIGLLAVAESASEGLLHLGGPKRMTRLEMGLRLAALLGADPRLLLAVRQADSPRRNRGHAMCR